MEQHDVTVTLCIHRFTLSKVPANFSAVVAPMQVRYLDIYLFHVYVRYVM